MERLKLQEVESKLKYECVSDDLRSEILQTLYNSIEIRRDLIDLVVWLRKSQNSENEADLEAAKRIQYRLWELTYEEIRKQLGI